jgi:hypothetical protein
MSAQKSALDESLYQLLEKGRERKTTPGNSCNVPRCSTTGRSNIYPISLPNRATTGRANIRLRQQSRFHAQAIGPHRSQTALSPSGYGIAS